MLIMSLHYLVKDVSGIMIGKEATSYLWYRLLFKAHVLGGLLAIALGPFQFWLDRTKYRKLHRRLGYAYIMSIGLSGVAGLVIAQFSMGGWITAIGFSILSVLWLYVTTQAVISIRLRAVQRHRSFMILSYALTFAAITQRTLLLIPLLTEVPFMPIYKLSAWLPWLLNLTIAFSLIRTSTPSSNETLSEMATPHRGESQ